MECNELRDILQYDARGLHRLYALAHLLRCAECRAEARTLRKMKEGLREAGRFALPADLLAKVLAVPQEIPSVDIKTKGGRKMRRLLYVSLALLAIAIGAVIVVPERTNKPDAKSILIGVARAMEEAKSLYMAGYVENHDGPTIMPGTGNMELWLSPRKSYSRVISPKGALSVGLFADADNNKWWIYRADKHTAYAVDLTPIAQKAAEVIAGSYRMLASGKVMEALWNTFPDAKQSAAVETRNGRKMAVVTITFTLSEGETEKVILEVDEGTNRLLSLRQSIQTKGSPEKVVASIDKFGYDTPLPAELASLQAPKGAKTVEATARIRETEKFLSLVMEEDGKYIAQTDTLKQ